MSKTIRALIDSLDAIRRKNDYAEQADMLPLDDDQKRDLDQAMYILKKIEEINEEWR